MPFSNNHMSSNIFLNNHDQDHDDDDDDGDDVDDDGRICVFCGNGNGIVKVGRMHLHHGQVFPRSRGPPTSLVHIGLSLFCRLCEFLDANPSLSWNFCGRSSTVVFFCWWGFPVFCSCPEKRWSYFRSKNKSQGPVWYILLSIYLTTAIVIYLLIHFWLFFMGPSILSAKGPSVGRTSPLGRVSGPGWSIQTNSGPETSWKSLGTRRVFRGKLRRVVLRWKDLRKKHYGDE